MVMTPEERLAQLNSELTQVRAAITAILSGAQEYRIGSRSLRRADLGLLYTERTRLEKEIAEIENGGMFRTAYFEGR
ncbi:hypothetical protein J2TS6_42570 [Paenibacillus albilobatus]|uniref:Peptidylprolyl isomerase n=1 Tax=Paenibacillus albilobatus TaxID=2716884 RepID=A0A920CB37_9BACL|nr:hypothetical protein [Paenibacillus albilobatus]GIO33116.1 hypothetical protein J2TS6_42570 [Paenibacillus albilobatus]